MVGFLKRLLPPGSARRWVAAGFYHHPFLFALALFRSVLASWQLTGRVAGLPVRISCGQVLRVRRGRTATVQMAGTLLVVPWGAASGRSSITVGDRGVLNIRGEFTIGHNVHLSVAEDGRLDIGGVRHSTGSGITCDARVMAASEIAIDVDTIIAWGTFITDSDWHELDGIVRKSPVVIGDNVWIAHDCSILRGAMISNGCVVAAKSIVNNRIEEPNVLLAGTPAKIVRRNVQWSR